MYYEESDNLEPLRSILPPQFFWCADCRKLWTFEPEAILDNGNLGPGINGRLIELSERPCSLCMEDTRHNPYWVIVRGLEKARRRARPESTL